MNFTGDTSETFFGRALSVYTKPVRPRCSNRIARHPSQSVAATRTGLLSRTSPYFLAAAAVFAVDRADAASISVNDIFEILEQASVNNTGASTSPVLFIGADDVVPNGNGPSGTTGVATSYDGSIVSHILLNQSSTAFPNQISTGIGTDAIPYTGSNPNLLKSWTLTFANPSANPTSNVVQTEPLTSAALPTFANSVTVIGGTTTPAISWVGSGNGAFINIVDITAKDNTIYSRGDLPASGSFQIPSLAGLNTSDDYQIQVAEVFTRDGSSNTMHDNEAAISRALFNYTVSPTAPSVPLNIPMIDSSGVFHFNIGVTAGTTTYIDPAIATGYIYQIGAEDPDFASVTLPILPDQTNPYEIEWDNGLHKASLLGGKTFDFTGAGVAEFDVTGIDAANGLNPNDPTAFVTALTFEATGNFTGTMTAIIPEPSTWTMILVGFAGLGYAGYRSSWRGSSA